ncbi:MAG: sulfite exporter TauE/SafE family protein [Gammaproteobacteria bacterium]|nr:sulfite exporter TauE/SafE family protein [Gammaproteobacteria bacterium]NNC97491.1 sulfite exporter TauE/SafE family protein [Gammaproteobacteria bacterium]NNM13593.1 sulfite exporter TauE/SafE family protein [Gammaproteobacteria bacterium]
MFELILLGGFAFAVSLLTLFSGFGLGTLLLPAFVWFMPVEAAVATTALVHAANNLFKLFLLGRAANKKVLMRFGLPAVVMAFVGAYALTRFSGAGVLYQWEFLGREAEVSSIKIVLGSLILAFALFELVPRLQKMRVSSRYLSLGGAMSGFFGGLSGHQGALRAAFLTPLGLSSSEFVATQAVLAVMVDAARLLIYGWAFVLLKNTSVEIPWNLVAVASVSAFAGAVLGKKMLHKVTMHSIRLLVGSLLLLVGAALVAGIA